MKIEVVTSFDREGWDAYAERFVSSFLQYWPSSVNLWCFYSGERPEIYHDRLQFLNLLALPNGPAEFLARHGNDPRKRGWDDKRQKFGFRMDACKFMHKVFAIESASLQSTADMLIWCDADVVTHAEVPLSFLESQVESPCYLAYLGREAYSHSECGWMCFRTHHPYHREFMERYAGIYRSGRFETEREWHDSFLFDVVRREMESEGKILSRNLTPRMNGHVFVRSDLGKYMDHIKGRRKQDGHSWAQDFPLEQRPEPYWRKVLV